MNIGTALNKKYIPYTTTMLTSLCENNARHIEAFLFNSELSEKDLKVIEKALADYDISIVSLKVDKERFDEKFPRNDQWSLEAYYRLFMFELLPESVDRLLYLDGDIVVNKDISDLYVSTFEDCEMIVCDDKGGLNTPESYGDKHREMFKEAYNQGFRYFNSGVLLINVRQMRRHYSFEAYLEAIKKWNFEMEAPDQDILNYLHWEKVKYADYKKYDLFARVAHNQKMTYEYVKENTAIIHFPGYKPWEAGNFHFDIEKLWWEYAKKTPFYEELLKSFVIDELESTNVADFVRQLEKDYFSKKDLLQRTMTTIESILSNGAQGKKEDKTSELSEANSIFNDPAWHDGYWYSEDEKADFISQAEAFLQGMLTNTRLEDYATGLKNQINELDAALAKANMIISSMNG